jgi:hypothetical protein
MTKKHWFLLAAILAVVGIGVLVIPVLAAGFFFGHEEAVGNNPGLPVYTTAQSASAHAGYFHDSLTGGGTPRNIVCKSPRRGRNPSSAASTPSATPRLFTNPSPCSPSETFPRRACRC